MPAFRAPAAPIHRVSRTSSTPSIAANSASTSAVGASATTTICVSGEPERSAAIDRWSSPARSSATSTAVARTSAGSSSRDGTASLVP